MWLLFPTLGVGLLDFNSTLLLARNSSPRLELLSSPGILLAHPSSFNPCPAPESPCSAQPQSIPEMPNSQPCPRLPSPSVSLAHWSSWGGRMYSFSQGGPEPTRARVWAQGGAFVRFSILFFRVWGGRGSNRESKKNAKQQQ